MTNHFPSNLHKHSRLYPVLAPDSMHEFGSSDVHFETVNTTIPVQKQWPEMAVCVHLSLRDLILAISSVKKNGLIVHGAVEQAQQVARESNAISDFPIQVIKYSLPRKWGVSVTTPKAVIGIPR